MIVMSLVFLFSGGINIIKFFLNGYINKLKKVSLLVVVIFGFGEDKGG